jgi:hypothetical protein
LERGAEKRILEADGEEPDGKKTRTKE